MKVLIECPFCENRFEIESTQSQPKIKCGLCKNDFEFASNRVQESPLKVAVVKQTPPQPPLAQPVASSPPMAQAVSGASPDLVQPESGSIATGITRSTRTRARLKRKKSLVGPIIMGAAVIISAIALFVVLAFFQPDQKKQTAKNNSPATETEDTTSETGEENGTEQNQQPKSAEGPDAPDSKGTKSSVFRGEGVSDDVVEPPTNAPPDKPPKMPSYSYFSSRQVEDFWRKTHNHVVRLKVDLGSSSHYVAGTIVDRRGWVVTSLSGVKNAQEIEVQNAAEDLQKFNGVRLDSTDSVRGVLAQDPVHDLVILSINRELVRSLSEVKIRDTDSVVGGLYLLQCSPPGTENFAWPKEVLFSRRKKFDDLDFEFQSRVEDLKFSQQIEYMLHNGYSDTCVGAPLLDEQGQVFGINSSINDKSTNVIAIPGEAIKELMATVSGDAEDISTLSN